MPEVIFAGPEGRLEGRYQHGRTPDAPIALFLHPHPEHGGTMNNKVVYHLYHSFSRRRHVATEPGRRPRVVGTRFRAAGPRFANWT